MIPVDLNRLREALSDWRDDRLGVAGGSERLEAVADAVLAAPTVWWCAAYVLQGPGDRARCREASRSGHDKCGPRALVPVKGES